MPELNTSEVMKDTAIRLIHAHAQLQEAYAAQKAAHIKARSESPEATDELAKAIEAVKAAGTASIRTADFLYEAAKQENLHLFPQRPKDGTTQPHYYVNTVEAGRRLHGLLDTYVRDLATELEVTPPEQGYYPQAGHKK